jgi:hypothetical protein
LNPRHYLALLEQKTTHWIMLRRFKAYRCRRSSSNAPTEGSATRQTNATRVRAGVAAIGYISLLEVAARGTGKRRASPPIYFDAVKHLLLPADRIPARRSLFILWPCPMCPCVPATGVRMHSPTTDCV